MFNPTHQQKKCVIWRTELALIERYYFSKRHFEKITATDQLLHKFDDVLKFAGSQNNLKSAIYRGSDSVIYNNFNFFSLQYIQGILSGEE